MPTPARSSRRGAGVPCCAVAWREGRTLCQHTPGLTGSRRFVIEAKAPQGSFELRIESLAAGGDGVGHAPDGRVVFVPFTAPGDRVRVRVTDARGRFCRARVERLLEAGPARVDPVCPVFGSCGGCAWQHVGYDAQLDAKVRMVEDALARIGGVAFTGEIERVASPGAYGYRTRTRLVRRNDRLGYRRRRSRAVQTVARCPVLAPQLDVALHELASRREVQGGAEEEWEIAQGEAGVRVTRLTEAGPSPGGPITLSVRGDSLRVSPGVFFQANGGLHEAMVSAVVEAAGQGDHVLEVFAGVGFFTLALSRAFERVTAIESDPSAVGDLRHNLEVAGRSNVTVIADRLEETLPALSQGEVLVLDPPRSGLPAASAGRLLDLAPRRVGGHEAVGPGPQNAAIPRSFDVEGQGRRGPASRAPSRGSVELRHDRSSPPDSGRDDHRVLRFGTFEGARLGSASASRGSKRASGPECTSPYPVRPRPASRQTSVSTWGVWGNRSKTRIWRAW
ncbi:MAG: class I SAM-dependent RNA methyltransferase [Myxococcales bacterium]|nr:MAG: class I SAM-dependent RNA methyltransferase [Myxococcales bacterium]